MTRATFPYIPLRGSVLCALLFWALLALLPQPAHGAAQPNVLEMRTDDNRPVRWDLAAESVIADDSAQIFEAEGRVVLRRGQEFLKADFARYFASTGWIYLRGNVEISFDGTDIVAEEAEFDLRSKTGWLKRGQIFVGQPHLYFTGEHIEKYWGDIYLFKDATLSACIGDSPAWSMAAEEAVVELDGYARLSWPKMRVMDQTVLALPAFLVPVKQRRQTGFLVPEYGRSSRDGLFYSQGFFWAIDETQDITLNEQFMVHRGFMHSIEYRANPRSDQMAWARLDYIHDDKIVTDDRFDPVNSRDGLIRDNRHRFWLRGMYDGYFEDPTWRFKIDLDAASDQNFLREFKRDAGGFDRTREELFSRFGRDLNERDALRTSQIQILRDWERFSLAFSGRYDQDPRLEHGNAPYSSSTTPQRLPEVNAYLHRGSIVEGFPLEIEASAQAVRFQREEGARGMRYDIHPRVSLPLVSEYGSLVFSGGLRQTNYATERTETISTDSGDNTGDARTLGEFGLAAMTELAGVYDLGFEPLELQPESIGQTRWNAVQHVVQPRLNYQYTSKENQLDNPFYDSDDRISERNDLTFSLVNILNRRQEAVTMVTAEDGTQEIGLKEDYLEFLRFTLSQRYSFREMERTQDRDKYERRPFGDIQAELKVQPISWLNITAKSDWSPYLSAFTRHDISVGFNEADWGTVSFGYNFRRKLDEYTRRRGRDVESLSISGSLNVWDGFYVGGTYKVDLALRQDVERRITVMYQHECFTLYGDYIKDSDDERFQLSFELLGFGS